MKTRAQFIGRDDFGNDCFLVTIYDPIDPDVFAQYIHTEWNY